MDGLRKGGGRQTARAVLRARDTWSDPAAYDAQAQKLAGMFRQNFQKFADQVSEEVRAAGPRG